MKKTKKNSKKGMAIEKSKQAIDDITLNYDSGSTEQKKGPLVFGRRTAKDLIAVDVDRTGDDYLKVGEKYVRTLMMNGVPALVQIGWLDQMFNFEGDSDTIMHIHPADTRSALDELTAKITQYQAQLDIESKKGNIRNITLYTDKIENLMEQRRALEQNYENLYYVQIGTNIYEDSFEELNRQSLRLENALKGRRINVDRMFLTEEDAYKTVLPIGMSFIKDKFRNFNTGALCACFPFYNSEICHNDGVFIGMNLSTMTPIFIDIYDRRVLNNSNMSVFGTAGSGKTFFVSLLTMRSALKGIRSVIIDPEGEYSKIAHALGGVSVKLVPGSTSGINPMEIDYEDETDDFGKPTGKQSVDIKGKVADVLDLICVMVGDVPAECKNVVSAAIQKSYTDLGITTKPESLYESGSFYDEESDELIQKRKKHMPTLSTFRENLKGFIKKDSPLFEKLSLIYDAMGVYVKGGLYDLFDRETSEDLQDFLNAIVLNFDVSHLEQGALRPLAMYVAMTWTWEKIVKKNPTIKKRIICDEAWMLVSKNIAGHEFTSTFLETCARRIRKRNGGLLVASQNFTEFADSSQGRAVLTNTTLKIFLKQNSTDIDAVQEAFQISDGEKSFLLSAKKGSMLIRLNDDDVIATAMPSDYERDLISINRVVEPEKT